MDCHYKSGDVIDVSNVEDMSRLKDPNCIIEQGVTLRFYIIEETPTEILLDKKPEVFKNRVIHQFLPVDSYFIVQKFLNHWKPRACIFVESEIWPNFIYCARKKAILSFLINARISQKSAWQWLLLKKLGFNIFDYFINLIL